MLYLIPRTVTLGAILLTGYLGGAEAVQLRVSDSGLLLQSLPVVAGEVVDATVMQAAHLRAFLINMLARAKAEDVLFSVHLKATMMKVSDPIIFGHVVKAYFTDVFDKYGDDLAAAGTEAAGRKPLLAGRFTGRLHARGIDAFGPRHTVGPVGGQ